MFLPLDTVSENDRFDYCIVGSGPAGMVCAIGLAQAGKTVILLEGGDVDRTTESQSVYQGAIVGDPYFALDACRLRQLGGTSNHWAGWCRALDEIDFEPKKGIGARGWPIERSELNAHLKEALRILEIDEFEKDVDLPGGTLKQVWFQRSPPVRFADKYAETLESSRHIAVALNANLIGLDPSGASVIGAKVVDYNGNQKTIRADTYILAAGGIENSRLLLWANEQTKQQVVRKPDTLGRFWTEHPHHRLGEAILTDDFARRVGEYAFFAPTAEAIRDRNILNGRLWVRPSRQPDYVKGLIAELACVAPTLSRQFFGLFNKNLVCGARVQISFEQEPLSRNRIELSDERDALGVPRTVLYWEKSEQDTRTAQTIGELFGAWLARSDSGRLHMLPWLTGHEGWPEDDELAGNHHMGGTRMASSAANGVVDENCKVFGQENLYVVGSSVFPSGGYANPTLTIIQLSLRLVDRLRNQN